MGVCQSDIIIHAIDPSVYNLEGEMLIDYCKDRSFYVLISFLQILTNT